MTRYLRRGQPVERREGIAYAANPRIERLVFICGLHRSGTTLLEHLLVSALRLSCLRMTVPENEGQHAQTVYSPAAVFGGPGRFAFSQEMERELHLLEDHDACRARILADWKPFVSGDFPALIEKSPPNLTKIWWLRKVFPGSKFLILTRDPRAVAGATQKRWGNGRLEDLVRHWHVAHSMALRDMDDGDCLGIRYEDLLQFEERTVTAISRFLGVAERSGRQTLPVRFRTLSSSNEGYIAMHGGRVYGAGAWNAFGYDI